MSQPPPSDHGNVVDPKVLAERRAARAEGGEEPSPEQRLFELEQRLGEVAAERDALKTAVEVREREVRATRQREWAEQQQRLEAQGEAAATRELTGAQVAELRERLAEAEAEVAVLIAERDRARVALEDSRAGERVERERRAALEREHARLRGELERRDALAAAAVEVVGEARRELARERAARADAAGLEARLRVERVEFAARVVAVEGAVAAVRDRLGAAARVLRERLDGERAARVAAETALDGLHWELARRDAVEAQLRTALDGLHAELEAVRAGDGARSARLAAQVESVLAIAAGLRDGMRRELSAEQEAFAASLTAMQERVAELQEGVAAADAVRAELETERAARWVAEAELDAERRRGDADRAARTFAESRLAEVESELDDLRASARPASAPDPAALASLRAALAHLRTDDAGTDREPSSLGLDLAAAAARLRLAGSEGEGSDEPETTPPAVSLAPEPTVAIEPDAAPAAAVEPEPPAADEPEPPVDIEPDAPTVDIKPEPPVAVEPDVPPVAVVEPEPPVAVEPDASPAAAVEPEPPLAAGPAPAPPAVTSTAPPPSATAARVPLPARDAITKPGPWLRDALTSLANDEPDIAELLFVALLPAQGGTVKQPIAYELAVHGGTTHRVTVDADRAQVELPGRDATVARIAGPLTALVPLAAGGAGRRLPGTFIENRRALRRVLKARRSALGLAELAASGVAPSPGLLLTVLARSVKPAWTADHPLKVDIAPEGADRWRVVASGRGPLAILPADPDVPAAATLHTSASRLPAVLAGTADPADAWVQGDLEAVQTLLSWLDRAQRGKR